jgi:aquaporin NIP
MKRHVLECVGTFILVLLVTGALVLAERTGFGPTGGEIALVYGLTLAALTATLGKYTGAHLNPAVTLAYSLDGILHWKDTVPYLLSQCAGALAASALLRFLFPTSATLGAIIQTKDDAPAFTQEFTFTLILITGILSVPRDTPHHRRLSALVAGSIAALAVFLARPVSGSGMNPARALGPALISGQTAGLWIYLTAPLCAASAAAGLRSMYEAMRPDKTAK